MQETNAIDWNGLSSNDHQLQLLTRTVNHAICKYFPPRKEHQISLLKKVIQQLENHDFEVCDELYEKYTDLLSLPSEKCENSYKTYFIAVDKWVTLKESTNFVSQGTTGLCTWQAALHLAEWSLENKIKFKNKRILELGSGVGLTGIVIQRFCDPQTFIFSDCHQEVLNILQENVTLNRNTDHIREDIDFTSGKDKKENVDHVQENSLLTDSATSICYCALNNAGESKLHPSVVPNQSKDSDLKSLTEELNDSCGNHKLDKCSKCEKTQYKSDKTLNNNCINVSNIDSILNNSSKDGELNFDVGILNLDWENCCREKLLELSGHIDVILAADVVYDASIIPHLVSVLHHLLSSENSPVAHIVSTVRNEETIDCFLKSIASSGLQYREIEDTSAELFLYDRSQKVLHLEIQKNDGI